MDQETRDNALGIKELIQSKGLKATHQRIAVYKAMCELGHASADMIIEHVLKIFPTLTVATVYNILDSFASVGLLRRIPSSEVKMFFDINTENHIHIFDVHLQSFIDFHDDELKCLITEHLKIKYPEMNISGFDLILKARKAI